MTPEKEKAREDNAWKYTWLETKALFQAEREKTPARVAIAETKYRAAYETYDAAQGVRSKRLKAIAKRIRRLVPTGCIEDVDTASRRIAERLETERAALVLASRLAIAPDRMAFVQAEQPTLLLARGLYEHKAIVARAIARGENVRLDVLAEYPDLAEEMAKWRKQVLSTMFSKNEA